MHFGTTAVTAVKQIIFLLKVPVDVRRIVWDTPRGLPLECFHTFGTVFLEIVISLLGFCIIKTPTVSKRQNDTQEQVCTTLSFTA